MHNIQRKILNKLLYAQSLGYAQMRPVGVESNHFAYHLEQLVREGVVTKNDRRYSLSPAGLAIIDRMSQEAMTPRVQPHILTAIDITTPQGQTLLFRRNFQPYFHCLSLPLGKTHIEETIGEAALRELEEKSGITGIPLDHRGVVYVDIKQDGMLISKVLTHIFSGQVAQAVATISSKRGECIWANPDDYPAAELMPGLVEIKNSSPRINLAICFLMKCLLRWTIQSRT